MREENRIWKLGKDCYRQRCITIALTYEKSFIDGLSGSFHLHIKYDLSNSLLSCERKDVKEKKGQEKKVRKIDVSRSFFLPPRFVFAFCGFSALFFCVWLKDVLITIRQGGGGRWGQHSKQFFYWADRFLIALFVVEIFHLDGTHYEEAKGIGGHKKAENLDGIVMGKSDSWPWQDGGNKISKRPALKNIKRLRKMVFLGENITTANSVGYAKLISVYSSFIAN